MDTPLPLEMLLPIVGFVGGLLLWSRIVYLAIALSGLTPNPKKPWDDFAALEAVYRRLVLRVAAAWMIIMAALLVYMLHHEETGFALLFAGIAAVPLLTVTLFLRTVSRFRRRTNPPTS